METFYIATVKCAKTMESGAIKRVSEKLLVSALSFTECEAMVTEYMQPQEFEVAGIAKTKYCELLRKYTVNEEGKREYEVNGDESFFDVKVCFMMLDEKSGEDKKSYTNLLVFAKDIDDARRMVISAMKGTMAAYTIESIKKTNIVDHVSLLEK